MTLVISQGQAVRSVSTGEARLREAISVVSRRIEDTGWVNLSADPRDRGIPTQDRLEVLERCRLYRRRSPLAKQAAKLVQHYALGQGVTLRANDKRLIKRIVDEFWDDPVNRRTFTGHTAMTEFIDGLFTDGDQFIVLFPDEEEGTLQLGSIDAAQVVDIVTDPNNWRVPLWYKVRRPRGAYNFRPGASGYSTSQTEIVWYRDWRNDQETGGPGKVEKGLIYHVAINKAGKFGEPELAAGLDWVKAHKQFMEDRATISRAAAAIAWRKKRKGGGADVRAAADQLRSTLVNTMGSHEGNPAPAAGSTIIENESTTMEWVKTDTGGSGAHEDERMLRMMFGSSVGVANHYFGDEGNANLATATAMELPMLKMYEGWQKLLADTIEDLITMALEVAHSASRIGPRDDTNRYSDVATTGQDVIDTQEADEDDDPKDLAAYDPTDPYRGMDLTAPVDWFVDVDFPPIVQKDLKEYAESIKILSELMPAGTQEGQRLVLSMILNAAGTNNLDETLDRVFTEVAAVRELAAKNPPPPAQPAPTLAPGSRLAVLPGGQPTTPVEESGARVRRVLAAVREASQIVAEADAPVAAAAGG